ncbi:MAG: hypothetical protein EA422_12980 [Gemmatimonadales bacterium]|nr:MAG: hypothetical protein EA422_12980 [Gemmatimonadales bacterium]
MFFRSRRSAGRDYLQLVENRRVEGRVRQRMLASLGRVDELEASCRVAALTESLARLTEELGAVRLPSSMRRPAVSSIDAS